MWGIYKFKTIKKHVFVAFSLHYVFVALMIFCLKFTKVVHAGFEMMLLYYGYMCSTLKDLCQRVLPPEHSCAWAGAMYPPPTDNIVQCPYEGMVWLFTVFTCCLSVQCCY